MNTTVDKLINALEQAFARLTKSVSGLSRSALAWGSIGLAAVLLLSVNLLAANVARNVKADVTQQRVFTMSKGTREIVRSLDEPISLKLYYNKRLGEAANPYERYFDRVRNLLQQYRDVSRGKIELAVFDPEPFSDAEDRAVAAGLRGVRLNQEGEVGYFGLVGSNSTDNEATISFFTAEREAFVEYDITKLIYTLSNPKKRVVGLIAGIPLDGGANPNPMAAMMGGPRQMPPQQVMDQIREFFEVKSIGQDIKEVPADVDILMIVQPDKLTGEAAYAIDQWVLKGGKVLAFVDPVAELGRAGGPMMMMGPSGPSPDFLKVMKAWGVEFDPSRVVGDLGHARRVQYGSGARPVVTEYIGWMSYDKASFDPRDVLSSGIEKALNVATPGALAKVDGATTQVAPILVSSQRSALIGAEAFGMSPDPVALLRGFKPENKRQMLAVRVSGEAKSAFPDGAPKPVEEKKDDAKDGAKPDVAKVDAAKEPAKEAPKEAPKPHTASGRVTAIVIADTDLLSDQFWVEVRDFLGQQVAIPTASNAAFVVNALDNLGGSEALIGLRARGADDRPFTLVNNIRRDAERAYREKEFALTAKLKEVQEQLSKLESGGDAGAAVLSESDRHTIERFRADMLNVRRDLREVKRALRADIDQLAFWLQLLNIALVPMLIGIGGVAYAVMQRRRSSATATRGTDTGSEGDQA
ncbi:MAG: Gldg family protein [Hyphomicrobiaceae bacterium]|nr:Gldg family protein [Hyphomicrobiaceae bacterium]